MSSPRAFERLEKITYRRVEWMQVGHTFDEITAAAKWVKSLGHEASIITTDGFRYRSIYPEGCYYPHSEWHWVCPGQWLVHQHGEGQEPELDSPHDSGPDEEDYRFRAEAWTEVTPEGADS